MKRGSWAGSQLSKAGGSISARANYPDSTSPYYQMPLILFDGASYYLYGPGGIPYAQTTTGGVTTYLHPDQSGSIRLITSTAGASVGTATYRLRHPHHHRNHQLLRLRRPVHRHRNRPAMAPRPLLRPHHRPVPHPRPPDGQHWCAVRLRKRQPSHAIRSDGTLQRWLLAGLDRRRTRCPRPHGCHGRDR